MLGLGVDQGRGLALSRGLMERMAGYCLKKVSRALTLSSALLLWVLLWVLIWVLIWLNWAARCSNWAWAASWRARISAGRL